MFIFINRLLHFLDFKNFICLCQIWQISVSDQSKWFPLLYLVRGNWCLEELLYRLHNDHHSLSTSYFPWCRARSLTNIILSVLKNNLVDQELPSPKPGMESKAGMINNLPEVTEQYVADSRPVNSEGGNLNFNGELGLSSTHMKWRVVSPWGWEMANGKSNTSNWKSNFKTLDPKIQTFAKLGRGGRFTHVENSIGICTSLVLKSNLF